MGEAGMGLPRSNDGEARFSAYVEGLTSVIGHADRAKPLRDYCLGLMMPCERKSVEPMAAITAPERTAAQHQSLLHFIGEGGWSDEKVLAKVRQLVLPELERDGPIEAWIIDDTSFPKKGQHSVGVARQYCGELGKQDNCQVSVTLRACQWPIGCICRRSGRAIATVGAREEFLTRSASGPSPRSRWHRSGGREKAGYHAERC